jgi:hypothetical protein
LFHSDPSPPMGERAAVRAETPALGDEARAEWVRGSGVRA